MEVYNVPEHGHAGPYLIQGSELNPQLSGPLLETTMYNEGASPEFVIEQGLYYPAVTNYGYFCTGLESPADWDDHQRNFGLDGQDIQYTGAQTENMPYVYYTPSYGYSQSPYNPYNPYIPGAIFGVDGQLVGAQQYYSIPSYENQTSSPSYYPVLVQSSMNGTADHFVDNSATVAHNRVDGRGLKHNLSPSSATFTMNSTRSGPSQTSSFNKVPEGSKVNAGPSKKPAINGNQPSGSFSSSASSQTLQGRGAQVRDNVPLGKAWSNGSQAKAVVPSGNGSTSFGSSAKGRDLVDEVHPKLQFGRISSDVNGVPPESSAIQNHGSRIINNKNCLVVKAYTTRAGNSDAQGNIIIYTDEYNRSDFPLEYSNAKFFVIKSYSEDDVHKSIKYNVWSSTPNGNKKLNSAYEEAGLAAGEHRSCPIFLFFSVNASGQFCGVAEMTGTVNFHKDMDFWQQDKWSGSFPVKWLFIKDVPNPNFRHIILENNENKPVTNSRDTQEIRYKKGIEMIKIFKNYISKTSLLDDFMYYENRQKILQEEKARLLIKKTYENPFLVPVLDPPRKFNVLLDLPLTQDSKITKPKEDLTISEKKVVAPTEQLSLDTKFKHSIVEEKGDAVGVLKIGSLSINPKQQLQQVESKHDALDCSKATATATANANANTQSVDVVTVGSLPVKVNGFSNSSGILTVGTIPLDPRALRLEEAGVSSKNGTDKG